MLRVTIVICIYSILKGVVINGNDDLPSNVYGLRSYNGESKFPYDIKPNLRTFINGGPGMYGGVGGYGGPGVYGGPNIYGEPGIYGGPSYYGGHGVHGELDFNAGVSIGGEIGIGREGGIGSDVGFGGTGGRIRKNGGILDSKKEVYLRQNGNRDRFRWG